MRLINTSTLQLHSFHDDQIPRYAILSHRWTDSEITLKDFAKARNTSTPGHAKVVQFCSFARQNGAYLWAWVDTVCIDKRSSAELSEAINSMYSYYANAAVCYAYLADVQGSNTDDLLEAFGQSEWFERGWTLQELLASQQVVFLASDWSVLGRKQFHFASDRWPPDVTLWAITQRTAIPSEALLQPKAIRKFSIAQRMSWAAGRKTTRVEDVAYCLLGLFGINLPLLYGEGRRAFRRLQVELIRCSHDESVYAWARGSAELEVNATYGVLAESPKDFEHAGDVVRVPGIVRQPWTVTHHGLEVPLKADDDRSALQMPGYVIPSPQATPRAPSWRNHLKVGIKFPLACRRAGREEPCEIVIGSLRCGHWGRIWTDTVDDVDVRGYTPMTVNFERQRIYLHVDECEDMSLQVEEGAGGAVVSRTW